MNKRHSTSRRAGERQPEDRFIAHIPVLRRFIARFCSSAHDIDDIAQEAYLKAFESPQVENLRSPRAFLLQVARNIALNELSRKSRWITERIEDALLEAETGGATLDEQMACQERLALFCEAASTLPYQCRRAFLLRKVYGYSQREIAQALEITESTVEKHVANGLLRCSRYMDSKEAQPTRHGAAEHRVHE